MVLGLTLLSCATSPTEEEPEPVAFGLVLAPETDPASVAGFAAALGAELGRPVETQTAAGFTALRDLLAAGSVDFALLAPATVVSAIDDVGGTPVAIAIRGGATSYRTQFSGRCDADITEVSDLIGARFGFVDPGSMSGYQVPYVTMLAAGLDPDEEMIVSFAGSHEAVILGIYQDDLDAGATFEDARSAIIAEHPDVNDVVCVLAYSAPIPNEAVVAGPEAGASLSQAVGAALIALSDDPAAQDLLQELFSITGFGPATEGIYDIIRDVLEVF